jgi:hypothetical protein
VRRDSPEARVKFIGAFRIGRNNFSSRSNRDDHDLTMDLTNQHTTSPNKLFLSGSDLHTPIGDGTHSPSNRVVNGTSSSNVGTFAVKTGLAQMLKILFPFEILLMERRGDYGRCQVRILFYSILTV